MESGECFPNITPLENMSSYHWKLLKLKGRLDTITERLSKRKSGTLEPYTTYMDEDSTDKIDKFLLMSQVKPLESDDDDMDLSKIN
ncbi:ACYPI002924 protein [Aphis craccivora]|uniref:ACYPI002924 protein n=1 Tax=Aphis craccivora TaxID=307492 RepID=A0A6G0YBC1_APHCR|nr:ACYPI002924 protein [Aphis craccivora]